MKHRATGSTTSGCRERAASAEGSSPSLPAKADSEHSPRFSTPPETASRASSLRSSSHSNSEWIYSRRNQGSELHLHCERRGIYSSRNLLRLIRGFLQAREQEAKSRSREVSASNTR